MDTRSYFVSNDTHRPLEVPQGIEVPQGTLRAIRIREPDWYKLARHLGALPLWLRAWYWLVGVPERLRPDVRRHP